MCSFRLRDKIHILFKFKVGQLGFYCGREFKLCSSERNGGGGGPDGAASGVFSFVSGFFIGRRGLKLERAPP